MSHVYRSKLQNETKFWCYGSNEATVALSKLAKFV